jgi:N-glycosylase/DNA lyase
VSDYRIQRVVRKLTVAQAEQADREFWRRQTPIARIEAATLLWNLYYGLDDETTPRPPRVLTVTRRKLS